jgi:Icc protein
VVGVHERSAVKACFVSGFDRTKLSTELSGIANMRITEFHSEPISTFVFLNAGRGPGQFYGDRLPIHHARVDRLPEGISGVVVTADLQGRERFQDAMGGAPRLLGEVVPQWLVEEVFPLLKIKDPGAVAALLAGDFYTVPALDKRGGTGDVISVWHAFGDCFKWVAGVSGNHDVFGAERNTRPQFSAPLHYLDGDVTEISGICIGGIGGIIGKPSRPQRRTEEDYLRVLDDVLSHGVDVLLMHEGPDGPSSSQPGMLQIRAVLESHEPCLTIRGHAHWDEPFAEFPSGLQVLNVDARVVILTE